MEYHFGLVVSGLDEAEVDGLLDLIVAHVEKAGGKVGGGFAPVDLDDPAEERGKEGGDE